MIEEVAWALESPATPGACMPPTIEQDLVKGDTGPIKKNTSQSDCLTCESWAGKGNS